MPIQVTCPACTRSFNAPDAAAGRRAKCPKCSCPIDIPVPIAADVLEAEPVRPFADQDFEVEPSAAPSGQDDRKPCPMCGEMIQRTAVKCRFCGEVFDPAMKGMLADRSGDVREPGWQRVRSGLATLYYSTVIIFIAIILVVVATLVAGGQSAAAPRPANPPVAVIIVLVVGGLAILGAGLAMLIGQILCASVPPSSGARGFAIGTIVCLLANVLLNFLGGALHNQALSAMGNLACVIGSVLFILFVRRSARYLGNEPLAANAWNFLVFVIALAVVTFLGFMLAGMLGAPAIAGVLGLMVVVAGIISIVWYLRLLKGLMTTIDERMGVMSIIRDAGSAVFSR